MGLKITTDEKGTKIYRKDKTSKAGNPYTTYSAMISSKNVDGTYTNGFVDVFFKKGVSVNNKAVIKINNAFPVVNEYNGTKTIRYMITDFVVLEDGEAPAVANDTDYIDLSNIDDGEFPFE